MPDVHWIDVHTDPPYRVQIGPGLLKTCGESLAPVIGPCRLGLVVDSTVAPLYLDTVTDSLRRAGYDAAVYIYPAGEAHKNFDTLAEILEFLASRQLTRSDCVAALGGGVCGDMAGLAAALYLRGVRYVQLPTTLLAAVDSSVGGKTAIDLKGGKNLAGAFLQPSAVICDTDTLRTLPPAVFADGAAEAVKTAVLSDAGLFNCMEDGGLQLLEPAPVIAACVKYKAGVVERDEKEQGERKLLNLGHTVGHAIEKCSGYTIPHGHAVAAGLAVITRAARGLGWMSEDAVKQHDGDRVCSALEALGLPISTDFSAGELAEAALADKKRRGDIISIVVPRGIGDCFLKTIPVTELKAVFQAGLEG